jgi:hypothetical protein
MSITKTTTSFEECGVILTEVINPDDITYRLRISPDMDLVHTRGYFENVKNVFDYVFAKSYGKFDKLKNAGDRKVIFCELDALDLNREICINTRNLFDDINLGAMKHVIDCAISNSIEKCTILTKLIEQIQKKITYKQVSDKKEALRQNKELTELDKLNNYLRDYIYTVNCAIKAKKTKKLFVDKVKKYCADHIKEFEKGLDECPICLAKMKVKSSVKSNDCSHKFCEKCIVEWFKKHDTCPCCRKENKTGISDIEIPQIKCGDRIFGKMYLECISQVMRENV